MLIRTTRRLVTRPTKAIFNRASPQALDLLGWWPLMQTAGSMDELVAGRTTTLTDPGGDTHPEIGLATHFSRSLETTAFVLASTVFDFSGSFTISAWIVGMGSTGTFRSVITHRDSGSGGIGTYGMDVSSAEVCRFYIHSGGSFQVASGSTSIVQNELTHVVGVFDDDNNEIRVYVNGREDGSAAASNALVASSKQVRIGSWRQTISEGDVFQGLITDARIYGRAISDEEIWTLYDPSTRWNLYWYPTRRVMFDLIPVAGGGDEAVRLVNRAGSTVRLVNGGLAG